MFHSRLFWKLYLGYVVLILLTTIVIGVLVGRRIEQDLLEETQTALTEKAVLLRELVAPALADPAALDLVVRRVGGATRTRFAVFDPDGAMLAASDGAPAVTGERIAPGTSTRTAASGVRTMNVVLPIGPNAERLGLVRASLELTDLDERLARLRSRIALGAALATLLALVVGLFVGRWFTGPLVSMSRVAQSIAEGRFEERLEIRRRDEVGTFARSFNAMADQLRGRILTITDDRDRLLAVLGGMVEGVVAVDRDERILHVNAVASRILRMGAKECEGRPVWEVTRIHEISEVISQTLATSSEMSREMELREGGMERIIEMYSAPILGSGSEVKGAVVVLHDVTALRRLEGVRRDFVANVSHELKTPLTVIRGFVETMIDDPGMSATTRAEFLERIRLQSDRLSAIVTDLLTLSRVESGDGALRMEPLELGRIARVSYQALAPTAERRRLGYELNVVPEPVPVLGDEHYLRLMIDNLLDNAVKYTPQGGRVSLAVKSDQETVQIEVRDTGIGIEPRHRERIFERFYRVDKGRSREMGGTGLGLSIVRHVVLAHGGQVTVDSIPGKGTTFRVTLPRASGSSEPSAR